MLQLLYQVVIVVVVVVVVVEEEDGGVHLLIRDASQQKDDVNRNACDPRISAREKVEKDTNSLFRVCFEGHTLNALIENKIVQQQTINKKVENGC